MDDTAAQDRVELVWPNKHQSYRVFQQQDGSWGTESVSHKALLRGLTNVNFREGSVPAEASFVISGQRHDALSMLSRSIGPAFRLIYVDLPRLKVDDVTTAFQSISPLRLTTWLSVVRAILVEARELLNRKGVVAVHCGEDESQYARIVLDELFRDKRVGTIVWQKAYSAQNMPGMKAFTDTHDLIYIYARDLDALPAVGLRRPPKDYANSDSDPRGAWKAEHKGAKTFRENSDFDTYQPPYRWKLVGGQLPPGFWRISPYTGVIWASSATTPGTYRFTAEVSDQKGATSTSEFSITVKESGEQPTPPDIPWLFEEMKTKGPLKIAQAKLPDAIAGKAYSTILLAQGGVPFTGAPIRPGSGRYWDFAKATLIVAYQSDSVYLGNRQPTSIPTPKKYEPPKGVMEVENQQSIWLGRLKESGGKVAEAFAGFTEDATKHLKALKELKLINSEISTAKPEKLLLRLLEIFTDKDDLVLEVMSSTADLTAVALKCGRRAFSLQGCSDRDRAITAGCALPRLNAILSGEDRDLEQRAPKTRLSKGAYIPYSGGGSLATAEIGQSIAVLLPDDDHATLTETVLSMKKAELISAILTAEGYLPPIVGEKLATAMSGKERALVIPPDEYITPELISEIASSTSETDASPVNIYYFKATEDIDEKLFDGLVTLRRVPFDLLRLDVV